MASPTSAEGELVNPFQESRSNDWSEDDAEKCNIETVSSTEGLVNYVKGTEDKRLADVLPINYEHMDHYDFAFGAEYASTDKTSLQESVPGTSNEDPKKIRGVTVDNCENRELSEDETGEVILGRQEIRKVSVTESRHLASKPTTNMDDSDGINLQTGEPQAQAESLMSQSVGSEESTLSEDRFVKVKICEVEGSSKASSESGKDELEEQILSLSSANKKLRSDLVVSKEEYLKVKLELESRLIESQTQTDTEAKCSQEVQRLKEKLTRMDDELVDLRILIEEAVSEDFTEDEIEKQLNGRSLAEMFSLLKAFKKKESEFAEARDKLYNTTATENLLQCEADQSTTSGQPQISANENLELIALRAELAAKTKELEIVNRSYSDREAEVLELSSKLQEMTDNESNIIGGYQAVSTELANLQQSHSALAAQLQFAQDELSVRIDVSKEELDRLKEELLAKDDDMLEIQNLMDELQATLEKRNNKIEDLTQKLARQSCEIEQERSEMVAKIQDREELLCSMEGNLSEKDVEITASKTKIEKLKKVVMNLKRQSIAGHLPDAVGDASSRPASTSQSTEDALTPDNQIEKFKAENQKLRDQLQSICDEKQNLEETIKTMGVERQELEFSIDEKDTNLSRSMQQVEELLAALDEKNSEIEKLVRSIDSKTTELTSCANLKGEEMQSTIEEYHSLLEKSESHARQLQAVLDEKTVLQEKDCNERDRMLSYISELQNRVELGNNDIKSLEQGLAAYKENEAHLKDSLGQKSLKLANVENIVDELLALKSELTAHVSAKSTEIIHLQNYIAEVVAENKQLSESKAEIQGQYDTLKVSAASTDQALSQMSKQIDQMSAEVLQLKELEVQLKRTQNEKEIIRSHLTETENRIRQIEIEFNRKSEEVEVLREMEVLSVKNELIRLKPEMEDLQTRFGQTHEYALRLESENTNLRNEVQSQEIALMESRERAVFFETEIRSVTLSTAHLETDINRLRETVIGLESQLARANSQIQLFKERIEREPVVSEADVRHEDEEIKKAAVAPISSASGVHVDIEEILEAGRKDRDLLEKKIDLLQSKISEIEISEIKSFEECLMLKGWLRQLEMENLKYQDHLRALQNTKDGDTNGAKAKTLQDEVLRLVHTLQERDNRCVHLTAEITRLLEERDRLQLRLSNALKQNMSLVGGDNQEAAMLGADESVLEKIMELQNINYAINIDLRREKEARRLVQEQLLLSQNSRFYFGRGTDPPKLSGQTYLTHSPPHRPSTATANLSGASAIPTQDSSSHHIDAARKPVVHI